MEQPLGLGHLTQFHAELNANRQLRTEVALLEQRIKFIEKKFDKTFEASSASKDNNNKTQTQATQVSSDKKQAAK